MRRLRTLTIRPALEPAETRCLTTAGIVSHAVPAPVHGAEHAVVSAEAHHAAPAAHQVSRSAHHAAPISSSRTASHPTTTKNRATTVVIAEAWVGLVNTTGSAVSYQISLYPYKNGQYLPFTIGSGYPNPTQYQYAGLTASGPGSVANFRIKFAGQAPTTLEVGSTEATAPLYSIFANGNGGYYVIRMIP